MLLINKRIYQFGDFELKVTARVLTRDGKQIPLGSKAFEVLTCLVAHAGEVVTKEELLKTVWPESFVEEGNLSQHIFTLRRALGDRSGYIVTIPGRGYQFTESVREVDPTEFPQPVSNDEVIVQRVRERAHIVIEESVHQPSAPLATRPRSGVFRWMLVAATVLAATAAIAAWKDWLPLHRTVQGDHHEIVLADFQNTTGDPEFDQSLNTALAIDLMQSPYLAIAPDTKVRETLKLMERSPQDALTPQLAREVCQRKNDQAVLDGAIARIGQKYLVTLSAVDCNSGDDLVETKSIAADRDGVLQAIDGVASDMRKRLGEPLRSIRRFSTPLLAKQTNSLDALRAYSEAHELGMSGKYQESIPHFQRAIELDPKFAMAYADLGTIYSNLGENDLSVANLTKAYQLRDLADEKDRLFIIASYHTIVTGDLHESLRNYETWTEIYPDASTPWANLANLQTQLGRYDLSIEPAKRAVAADPTSAIALVILARAQLRLGRIEDAKATCRDAIANKLDRADIHALLLQAAFLQQDDAGVAAQIAWAKGTPSEPFMTLQQGLMAFAQGRSKVALDLFDQLSEGYRKAGMVERANRMLGGVPRLEAYLGQVDLARQRLKALPPLEGSTDVPVALAEVGETAQAEALLHQELQKHPADTLWQYVSGPQIAAAIALSRNRPEEAIEALKASVPYELRSSEMLALRGRAYLAAHQPALAETAFRTIVDHPTADPLTANLPLAHLGLARAYALEGNSARASDEYQKFFALWSAADADLPVLKQARVEYAHLR